HRDEWRAVGGKSGTRDRKGVDGEASGTDEARPRAAVSRADAGHSTGAKDLMDHLTKHKVPWAVATSGALASARPLLNLVDLPSHVPVISRDGVEHAKPNPDLWLAAAARLGVSPDSAIAVGDSAWGVFAARG